MSRHKVLIHGAAGFVGSVLFRKLVQNGTRDFTLVDRVRLPNRGVGRLTDVAVSDFQSDSLQALPPTDVDVAVVLAGQTDVDEALAHPKRALGANVDIAVDVGEWLRSNREVRLVYLSTDEVLGPSEVGLAEDAPFRPSQPYAASKAAGEMILRCYADTYGLDLVIIRSCNLVGGGQRARKLIPTTVTSLLSGSPVPIYGSGHQVREWLAVEDLCDVLVMAVNGHLPGSLYNCSSGLRMRTLDVVDVVAGALEKTAELEFVTDRLVHDPSYSMDAKVLRSSGWAPASDVRRAMIRAALELATAYRCGEDLRGEATPRHHPAPRR